MTDIPIACSLAPGDYGQHLAQAADLARQALRTRESVSGGQRLHFAASARVRERLEAFVARESACCPFLELQLRDSGTELVLDITGPPEARPIIEELFASPPGAGDRGAHGAL